MIATFLAPYLSRIILYASLAAAIGGGFLYVKIHYEHIGRDKAIAAIAAKDERAISDVKAATQKVDDCYAVGRTFSTVSGLCN